MSAVGDAAARVAQELVRRGETVAVAESSAGGLISAALVAVPGASAFYLGGAVVYTVAAREVLAGLGRSEMAGLRSASPPYAALLARTMRERMGATWALAEAGASGPAGNRYGDAAGHCCIAVDGPVTLARTLATGSADRARNMDLFTREALDLLAEAIAGA